MLKSMRKSKNRYFYHILVSPGDAPGAIMVSVVWMEREFDAYKLFQAHTYLSSTVRQLFELQVQKIAVFTYSSPHFCFPWGRPWGNHTKYCMDGKRIRCLQIVSQRVPIYLQQFPVIRTASAKVAVFTYRSPHFCFPWGRP